MSRKSPKVWLWQTLKRPAGLLFVHTETHMLASSDWNLVFSCFLWRERKHEVTGRRLTNVVFNSKTDYHQTTKPNLHSSELNSVEIDLLLILWGRFMLIKTMLETMSMTMYWGNCQYCKLQWYAQHDTLLSEVSKGEYWCPRNQGHLFVILQDRVAQWNVTCSYIHIKHIIE